MMTPRLTLLFVAHAITACSQSGAPDAARGDYHPVTNASIGPMFENATNE